MMNPLASFITCPNCLRHECFELVDIFQQIDGDIVYSYHCHECHYANQYIDESEWVEIYE